MQLHSESIIFFFKPFWVEEIEKFFFALANQNSQKKFFFMHLKVNEKYDFDF